MNCNTVKINLHELLKLSQKPPVYSKGTKVFWQDPYISKNVLNTHLNPNVEKASKKPDTIEKEVAFIAKYLDLREEHSVIDLGCGPGLYCERLYNYCKNITGVDFSLNSINYGKKVAKERSMDIEYLHMNYLDMNFKGQYDAAFVIYYDLGTLFKEDMHILLDKINRALKTGGYFIFDVLTTNSYDSLSLQSNWYVSEGGFWHPSTHIVLEKNFFYPEENIFLYQFLVAAENDNIDIYRIYEKIFRLQEIKILLEQHGFVIKDIYKDLFGTAFNENDKTMGIFAQKVR